MIHKGRMLLVYRNTPPIAWAPPGGRLLRGENPYEGLQREVYEECRLQVDIVEPTTIWFGLHKGIHTIGIFFLCRIVAGDLNLSHEHSAAKWFSLEEIQKCLELDSNNIAFGSYSDYKRAFVIANIDSH